MPTQIILDITIRNPLAPRYLTQAANSNGYALSEAHKEKNKRYGSHAQVLCGGMEVFGRMHEDFRTCLHQIDVMASAASPHVRRPKFLQWAQRLQTALTRSVVRNILTAHRAQQSSPPVFPPPVMSDPLPAPSCSPSQVPPMLSQASAAVGVHRSVSDAPDFSARPTPPSPSAR